MIRNVDSLGGLGQYKLYVIQESEANRAVRSFGS